MKLTRLITTAFLALTLTAEELKPTPSIESQAAEITSLQKQLASALADKAALEVHFQLQMQVCNSPDLAVANAKAVEARKQVELAKPKPAPVEKK